ncbi:hypothetical protein HVZ60_04205 [Escherichia coli]|nr:hypothetical protein [Escherichia coli]
MKGQLTVKDADNHSQAVVRLKDSERPKPTEIRRYNMISVMLSVRSKERTEYRR